MSKYVLNFKLFAGNDEAEIVNKGKEYSNLGL